MRLEAAAFPATVSGNCWNLCAAVLGSSYSDSMVVVAGKRVSSGVLSSRLDCLPWMSDPDPRRTSAEALCSTHACNDAGGK
jgi:hypothetical protein